MPLDIGKTERILNNILTNAFTLSADHGILTISIKLYPVKHEYESEFENRNQIKYNEYATIEICLKDKTLSEEHVNAIFQPFYHIRESALYTGIGLSLANELAQLQYGSLTATNNDGKDFNFTLQLPVIDSVENLKEIKNEDIHLQHFAQSKPDVTEAVSTVANKSLLSNQVEIQTYETILIIEDNEQIVYLLKTTFESNFNVITAENGKEGVELALKEIPDLIISDIMMPIMEGTQVCSILKKDLRTSHIPIILLTAKTGEKNKIDGYKLGADDYIYKPFSILEIETRVENLLQSRKELRDKFLTEFSVDKKSDVANNNPDQIFLDKAIKIIHANIDRSDFGTQEFVNEVGLSRSVVHNKFKKTTNLSTSEFINTVKIKKAAILLANYKELSVSEVAYKVGFNDPTYFGKSFK
ncbi:MAG: response regulator, partial [Bacteroidales bacterium]|nr:response regulator [Bacteroidales bacterium]